MLVVLTAGQLDRHQRRRKRVVGESILSRAAGRTNPKNWRSVLRIRHQFTAHFAAFPESHRLAAGIDLRFPAACRGNRRASFWMTP
ncbi:hypothetical protein [Burkholderia sp. FL-7-2-10-S1-D7]|uniref:hypothetical protein n=1 Tax=Burkholderia sp. FL-7-2-10-S1-D7 TaxID=1637866 RepID=UPI0012E3AC87|nr:hypothetical protein [Burkholderia sp. FL-7-2-10-S1-D7]